jgi:hypothetical protein
MTASVRIRGCSRYRGNATFIEGGAPIWQPQCGSEAATGTEATPRLQREGLQCDSLSVDQRLLQVQRLHHDLLPYNSLCVDQRLLQVQRLRHDSGGGGGTAVDQSQLGNFYIEVCIAVQYSKYRDYLAYLDKLL